MVADLAAHVAIPTGTGHAPGIKAYRNLLIDRLMRLGARVDRHPGQPRPDWLDPTPRAPAADIPDTVTCACRGGAGKRILLAGHVDTVHDPFGPFQTLQISADGARAVGPGCADMKGGNLIALHALEALAAENVKIDWTFLLNADEETGSYHSAEALRAQAKQHDIGLAMEPALPGKANLESALAVARMGSGHFRFDVRGKSAHVGRDFKSGVSAVAELARIITRVSSASDPDHGLIVNVGPLKGGSAVNIVPDSAACWGNVRFETPADAQRAVATLEELATSGPDALPAVSLRRVWSRPAKPLTPAVQGIVDVIQRTGADLGQRITPTSTGGVCDGNILQDAGLPTIDTLGVRGGGTHTPQEWIDLPSLVERAQLLAIVILRLAHS